MVDAVLEGFLNSIQGLHEVDRVCARPAARAEELWNAGSYRTHTESQESAQTACSHGAVCGIGAKIGRAGRHVVIAKVLDGGAASASGAVFEGDILAQVLTERAHPCGGTGPRARVHSAGLPG
jgi:hypothetical protein